MLFWKEKIKSKQIKKELKENKETIINPNAEDTKNDEKFQEIIETAVAEKHNNSFMKHILNMPFMCALLAGRITAFKVRSPS